ncbi:GAF domain-containing protein [Tateyamaria pelophila]|uniref:GAF domain-containing protein n=1 Tax=Tateyamaria pelophila TaxID=328415 RepID=UPI001CBE19C1|nr:GAF domain-containing protein [Tateyamaria pelophila]
MSPVYVVACEAGNWGATLDDQQNTHSIDDTQARLTQALEREAATREILDAISQSRSDDLPVFDAILKNAQALCGAPMSGLILAKKGDTLQTLAAQRGVPENSLDHFRQGRMPMDGNVSYAARCILEGRLVAFSDMGDSDLYAANSPVVRSMVDDIGIRSVLFVPLMKGGDAIGCITLFRLEVLPFEKRHIELVETFAAQAVIAIENVRQFREVQIRLDREGATRRILEVISQSRDDDLPVFDIILESASRLCNAPMAILSLADQNREFVSIPAHCGAVPEYAKMLDGFHQDFESSELYAVRAIRECRVLRYADIKDDDLYRKGNPGRVATVEIGGIRSVIAVPLVHDGQGIGAIILYRREVSPFSDEDEALVRSFAAQAVIAIENVRQFREIQTRLKRERASAEVLELISKSRDDEAPVFDMILNRAATLCGSPMASLNIVDPDRKAGRLVAHWGDDLRLIQVGKTVWNLEGGDYVHELYTERSMRDGIVTQCVDLKDTERYREGEPTRREMVDVEGIRTFLAVPLIHGGQAIGNIALYRRDVLAFSDDQIALVESFAAQAVIAIENVRQFKALETLNAELGDRVKEQVGEIERMGRLKRFLPAAVADTVVSQGSEKLLASHRALLGVLFCDIRGFTAFCETAEPEETIEVLQSYHEEMGALIAAHGAGVDTRAGDGIMVLFNDPLPCDDPAGDALRLGIAMRARMRELCKGWRRHGHKLGFGVGISLGYATVGMVGSSGRYDYTASGTAVNLAARLCDQADDGEILLSPRAYTAVEDDFSADAVGAIALKGIHAPVEVFRVSGLDDAG